MSWNDLSEKEKDEVKADLGGYVLGPLAFLLIVFVLYEFGVLDFLLSNR